MVADATLEAAGAEPASRRRLGMADETAPQALAHRLVSHLSFRSVWFRNALRGAVGLALAVGVVEVTNVSHGFWVVLGTMSVLRSSALGTGATALPRHRRHRRGVHRGVRDHDRVGRPFGLSLGRLAGCGVALRAWRRP